MSIMLTTLYSFRKYMHLEKSIFQRVLPMCSRNRQESHEIFGSRDCFTASWWILEKIVQFRLEYLKDLGLEVDRLRGLLYQCFGTREAAADISPIQKRFSLEYLHIQLPDLRVSWLWYMRVLRENELIDSTASSLLKDHLPLPYFENSIN